MNKKVKEMLQRHCQDQAAAHTKAAEACTKIAERHSAIAADEANPSMAAHHMDLSECHKAAGSAHVAAADACLATHKSLGEIETDEIATGGSGDIKALASQVSNLVKYLADNANRISPNPMTPARPTLIPRFGGQGNPHADAISKVDPCLKHLVDDSSEAAT
jgi:hypothetical protein